MKRLGTPALALVLAAVFLISLIPTAVVDFTNGTQPSNEENMPDDITDALVNQMNGNINLTNEYDKIWEPNNIRGSTHAIAVTNDNEWMATAGGYLNDREIHLYRWIDEIYQYWPIYDAGDGIIRGDVMDVDFMDCDNDGLLEVVGASQDGRLYVFEQMGPTEPMEFLNATDYYSLGHQWELVWDSGLTLDAQLWSVVAYDIDHDSHEELIVGAWDSKVYVFDFVGSSSYPVCPSKNWLEFELVWDSGDTITDRVHSVAVTDSDADTRLEIVAGSQDNHVYLFEEIPCMAHTYELRWTSGEAIWAPVVSVTASQDLDDDPYGEIVASAYGQGVYVFEFNPTTEDFDVRKLNQGIKSWERGISMPPNPVYTGYEADEYIDRKVFGWDGYGISEPSGIPAPYNTIALGGASALGGPWDDVETTFDSMEQFVFLGIWNLTEGHEYGQFSGPYDIARAPDGTYYVTDIANDRVTRLSETFEPIMQFGGLGSGNGSLKFPVGITIDEDGFVYVADMDNSRVQKFTAGGDYVFASGTNGSGDGQFFGVYDVAVYDGLLYASDFLNCRINVLNATDGVFISSFGSPGSGNGQFDHPAGLAFDCNGFLYVVDQHNNRVQKFDVNGTYLMQFGSSGSLPGEFDIPTFVVVDGDSRIYVSDFNNYRIQKFSPSGELESYFGSYGTNPWQFETPLGLAFHPNGGIIVIDGIPKDVKEFGVQEFELLEVYNAHADQSGAYDIDFDSEGNFYVVDRYTPYIFKFSSSGQWIANWSLPNPTDRAWGVEVGLDDSVHVYDAMTSQIFIYDTEGELLLNFGEFGASPGQLRGIRDIAVDEHQIYITEYVNNRVSVFDYAGGYRYSFGSSGAALGQLSGPYGIEISPDDLLYLSEEGNTRIQIFYKNGTPVDFFYTLGVDYYLAFDDNGDLYTSSLGAYALKKYTPDGILLSFVDYEIGNPEVENQGYMDSWAITWRSENQSLFVGDSDGRIYMLRPYIALNNLAVAVVDFGQWEEIGGDATDNSDLMFLFDDDIDIENIEFQITNDFVTWESLNLSSRYYDYIYANLYWGFKGHLWLDVDHALRSAQWDEFRYIKIGVKGGVTYHIDGGYGSVARPIDTALVVTTGIIRDGTSDDDTLKVIVGTIDGEIMAYTASGVKVWESQSDQPRFSLGTSIWDIVQINGKAMVPTWIYNGGIITDTDIQISIPGFDKFISSTLVNIDGTPAYDLVATIQDGSDSRLVYYRNIGSNQYPSFLYIPDYFPDHSTLPSEILWTHSTVTMGDLDGDYDLDMIICVAENFVDDGWDTEIWYFEHNGSFTYNWIERVGYLSDLDAAVAGSDFLSRVSLINMDYDDDLDITVANDKLYYFEQKNYLMGSGFWFGLDETVYYEINREKKNETVFGKVGYWDFDLDLDIDVIIPHSTNNYTGIGYTPGISRFTYWRNTGNMYNIEWTKTRSMFEPDFTGTLLNPERGYDCPEFRDMNGDGIFDLLSMKNDSIDLFLGDMNHDAFLAATYPYVHMVEVDKRTQADGYWGYEAYDSWTNWRIFETWSMSLEYGDVDQDDLPEVFVGSFDNNLIAFEQVSKNTYRRSWRSQDFFLQQIVTGNLSPFRMNIFDMVIGDQDQDGREEIIVCAGLNIYVFEVAGNNMYDLVWVSEPLAFWAAGQSQEDDPTPKIPFTVDVDYDLDQDGYSEILVGAQDHLIIFENTGDNNYSIVYIYDYDSLEGWDPFIRDIITDDINLDGLQDIIVVGTEEVITNGYITASTGWVRYLTNQLDADEVPIDNNYTQFYEVIPIESAYCVDLAYHDDDHFPEIYIGTADGINIYECDDGLTPNFVRMLPTPNATFALTTGNTDGDSWGEVIAGVGMNITVFELNSTQNKSDMMYDPVWTSGELHHFISDICLGDSNVNNRTEIIATAMQGYLYAFEWTVNSSGIGFSPAFESSATASNSDLKQEQSLTPRMIWTSERLVFERKRRFGVC